MQPAFPRHMPVGPAAGTIADTHVPRHRHIINLVASFLVMCSAGSVYAWSIFVPSLVEEHGFTTAQTQLIFGIIIGVFSLMMLFVRRIESRLGLKTTASIGAVLFAAGYLVASFSGGSFFLIVLGIGVLSGAGMGFGYVVVLSNLVAWYPRHKGLATGIAVAGFGSGAILLSQIAQPILNAGVSVTTLFLYISIIYGVLFFVSGQLISRAPGSHDKKMSRPLPLGNILRSRPFWVLTFTFFAGTFAGLMLIGNMKPLAMSYGGSAGAAGLAIVLISVGNSVGRIVWGGIYDRIGGRLSVGISLVFLTVLLLLLPLTIPNDALFVVMCLVIGLFFGANFVVYASDVSDVFGVDQVGYIYPIVTLGYGVSGILGPVAGGWIYDASGTYVSAMVLSAVICFLGLSVYLLFMRKKETTSHEMPPETVTVPAD